MSSFSLRAHPSMTVQQLKLLIKEHAAEDAEFHAHMDAATAGGQESARSMMSGNTSLASPRMPAVAHASALALHLDGHGLKGALADEQTLADYGLDPEATDSAATIVVYFIAADPRAHTPPPEARFDFDAAAEREGDDSALIDLTLVFANAPPAAASAAVDDDETISAVQDVSSVGATALAASSGSVRQSAADSGGNDSDEAVSPTTAATAADLAPSSSTSSSTSRPSSGSNSVPASSGRAGAAAAIAVVEQARPESGLSLPTGVGASGRPRTGGGEGEGGAGHGIGGGGGDTGRRFLEDDGDIASQWSDDDGEHGHTQKRHDEDPSSSTAALDGMDPQSLLAAATKELAAAAGLVKGDLLDGYRLLRACRVDLPEEVTRTTLSACNPPLVDAVPEHLAEFTNLSSLDLSGNNLPLDRLRLLPMLDTLCLSANGVRDVDFSPILGIHYHSSDDPADVRARQWDLADLIGFPSLRSLDLQHNFLHPRALHSLAFLPKLAELSLGSNELPRLPPATTMAHFWTLTKLSLRDNLLGSGSRNNKARRRREQERELELARAAAGAARKVGHFIPRLTQKQAYASPSLQHQMDGLGITDDPSDARMELREDPDLADLLDEHDVGRKHAKEFALFRALAALPALQELDLSDNCITTIPAGAMASLVGEGGVGFPKLQFLNLAWNDLASQQDALPLGDLEQLQWLDLRGNPFVERAAKMYKRSGGGNAAADDAQHNRRAAHHEQRHGVRVNWASALPDLYHVLVENCRINVVLSRPRHAGQNMQQDLSHLLLPPTRSGLAAQAFTGAIQGPLGSSEDTLANEAAQQRQRVSSAKLRAFALQQEQQQQQLRKSTGRLPAAAEAKEDFSLGFSTAHEFADASQRPLGTSPSFVLQQQQQQLLQLQSNSSNNGGGSSSRRAQDATSASANDPYAEHYAAYSETFLTGMSVEDLQATRSFAPGAGASSAREQPTVTAGQVHYPHRQLLARRATQQATQTLENLLQQSAVPVLHAARPNHRVEGTKFPPVVMNANAMAAGKSNAARGSTSSHKSPSKAASSSHLRHNFTTNVGQVSLFGVRQPKVAKVYSKMDAVLQAIEASFLPGDHAAKGRQAEAALAAAAAASPNPRGVSSSAYVDPVHARTTDKLRALRHLEKERNDVQALLRTVSEVSKQVLASGPPLQTYASSAAAAAPGRFATAAGAPSFFAGQA